MSFLAKIKAFFRPTPTESITFKQPAPILLQPQQPSREEVLAQLPQDITDKISSCLPSDVAHSLSLRMESPTIEVMENEYQDVAAIPAKYPASDDEPFLDLLDGQMKSSWDFLFVSRGTRTAVSISMDSFAEEQCAVTIAQKILAVHEVVGVIASHGSAISESLPNGRVKVTVNFFTSLPISQTEVDKT